MENTNLQSMHETMISKQNLQNMRDKISKTVEEIKSGMTSSFGIDEILDKFTSEEIAAMSFEKMKEVFVDESGKFFFNEDEFRPEMIMDFIKYLKMSRDTFAIVDEEFAKMDGAIEEFSNEIETTIAQNGSLNKTVVADLTKTINDETKSEQLRNNAKEMLQGIEDAKTLAPLFKLYETLSVSNTLRELKDETRRINTLKAYTRVCKENHIEPKLLKLGEFETACLDLKYAAHKNLFIFIVARYIKYLDKKVREPKNMGFIIQLTNYVRTMMMGTETNQYKADAEELTVLKENICLLLDKFYN